MEPRKLQLSTLPPLILAEVTNLLHGGAIVALYCTGNLALMNIMSHGGVTHVKFEKKAELCRGKFPTCLSSFRGLRSLKINEVGVLGTTSFIGTQLRLLSPTLEKLSLNFRGSPLVFQLNRSVYLNRLFRTDESDDPSLWHLADFFPALKALSLDSDIGISVAHLSILPPGLTKLYLPKWGLLPISCLSQLPRGLVKLRLPRSMQLTKLEEIEALPTALDKLITACHISEDLLERLPSTLTYLGLFTAELTPQRVRALPRLLFECRFRAIENFSLDHLLALPPYLIIFHMHLFNFKFTAEALQVLPQTITDLSLNSLDLRPIPYEESPPSTLASEAIKDDIQNAFSVFSAQESTNHDVNATSKRKPVVCPFPSSLRILTLVTFQLDLIEYLPSSLTTFSTNEFEWIEHSEHYIKRMPPNLCNLELDSVNDMKLFGSAANFPKRLTRFKARVNPITNVQDLKIFPRSMTSKIKLTIPAIQNIHINFFPTQIQALSLSETEFLTPECFQYLPKSLVRLVLTIKGTVTTHHACHLPRYLEVLRLPGVEDMSDEAFQVLPVGLRELMLPSLSKNTWEALKYLPPFLEQFMAMKWSAPLECIQYVPRSLRLLLVTLPAPKPQMMPWLELMAPPLCRFAFGYLESRKDAKKRSRKQQVEEEEGSDWELPDL